MTYPLPVDLGQRIRTLRYARGCSAERLAEAMCRSVGSLYHFECGDTRRLTWHQLACIASELNVTAEDIVADDWRKRCQRGIILDNPL